MYLVGIISLFSIVMGSYHWKQNNSQQIGGNISLAKTVWLGLALFFYYVFSIWWLTVLPAGSLCSSIALLVVVFFYFRAIIQAILMFATKNWITAYGIAFNSIGSVLLTVTGFSILQQNSLSTIEQSFIGYLFLLICFQITDSYYAYRFGEIVGNATKGDKAIWFASTDLKFQKINQRTALLNTAYLVLGGLLIFKILMYDSL